MQALIAATGKPLAAPSANASGSISPTRAAHVVASLGGRIALVLDDGATETGLESTIVMGRRVLRSGPIPEVELKRSFPGEHQGSPPNLSAAGPRPSPGKRSEERRVGHDGGGTGRPRVWANRTQ